MRRDGRRSPANLASTPVPSLALGLAFAFALLAVGCERASRGEVAETGEPLEEAGAEQAALTAPADGEVVQLTDFRPGLSAGALPVEGWLRIVAVGEGAERLRLEARVEGLEPGPHDWHIHAGPCGEHVGVELPLTPLADLPGWAAPLEADGDGVAEGSVELAASDLALDEVRERPLSVRVYRGTGPDPGPVVACAEL